MTEGKRNHYRFLGFLEKAKRLGYKGDKAVEVAIDMLKQWIDPQPIERVTNRRKPIYVV